jgi:hypothetical protein
MKLCMFTPVEMDLERGWPGRIDGDQVIQLAAQTLQSFFTGGGDAREHAVYPVPEVVFRAPVLHPPSVRIFEGTSDFRFANPAAILNPGADIPVAGAVPKDLDAAIIGADGEIGGFTRLVEWTNPEETGEKSRDFALVLGPVVTTVDEGYPQELTAWAYEDWHHALWVASMNTRLYPGDIIAW